MEVEFRAELLVHLETGEQIAKIIFDLRRCYFSVLLSYLLTVYHTECFAHSGKALGFVGEGKAKCAQIEKETGKVIAS